jgi:DNA-binding GntR family transcriptional regulator
LLTDEAYQALKWRILTMEYAPGSFLNEQELQEVLGFGRTPVHLALHRLRYDGLVDIIPRRGVVVRSWSPREINTLLEARLPVEVSMVRLAAERATQGQVRGLKSRMREGRALVAAGDREGLMRLDRDFHRGLAEAAQNPLLAEVQQLLHQRSMLLWFVAVSDRREYALVQEQHEHILEEVAAHDPDGAAAAMERHLSSFRRA